jgi:hypothetical protein
MDQEHLIRTASALTQPPAAAAAEFQESSTYLAEELSRAMLARPDVDRLIGPGNGPMMQDNSRNFCRFMNTMFHGYEPNVMVETVLWVFRAYRSHGFQSTYWAANLDTFMEIARDRLSTETFASLYPFFEWLVTHVPAFVKISDQQLAQPINSLHQHPTEAESP